MKFKVIFSSNHKSARPTNVMAPIAAAERDTASNKIVTIFPYPLSAPKI